MSNEYLWVLIGGVITILVFVFLIPKMVSLIDNFVEKKSKPKKAEPDEKKHRYKTF